MNRKLEYGAIGGAVVALGGIICITLIVISGVLRSRRRNWEAAIRRAYEDGRQDGLRERPGSDERTFLDYALKIFHAVYCSDERGLSNWIRASIEAALEKVKTNSTIRCLTVPQLTLGRIAPTIIKTTPFRMDSDPRVLFLDFQLKWYSEARLKLAVTLNKYPQTTLTAGISGIIFEGTLRLGCHFVDNFPWAGKLTFSFVGTPIIDFDVRLLAGTVPLPINLRTVLADALSIMIWPEEILLPLYDWYSEEAVAQQQFALFSPAASATEHNTTEDADDEFSTSTMSTKYTSSRPALGILRIEVIEARRLVPHHTTNTSNQALSRNPYVKLDFAAKFTRRTTIQKKTLNPKFAESFDFLVRNSNDYLRIRIYDHDTWGTNEKLGNFGFALSPLVDSSYDDLLTKSSPTQDTTTESELSRPERIVNTENEFACLALAARNRGNEPLDVWLRLSPRGDELRVRLSYSKLTTTPPPTTISDNIQKHQFSLHIASLRVAILEATELTPRPRSSSSSASHKKRTLARSAYAVLSIDRQHYQTRTVRNANHPIFDETAEFLLTATHTTNRTPPILLIKLLEAKNSQLGDCVLTLDATTLQTYQTPTWITLQNTSSGRLKVALIPRYAMKKLATPTTSSKEQESGERNVTLRNYQESTQRASILHDWFQAVRAFPNAVLWQPDELATSCNNCASHFSIIRRRHHCRVCLKIFCFDCSQLRRDLPLFSNNTPFRICATCYAQVRSNNFESLLRSPANPPHSEDDDQAAITPASDDN